MEADTMSEDQNATPRTTIADAQQIDWQPWPPPKNGQWVIALRKRRIDVIRISWGVNRSGQEAWCSSEASYTGDEFCAWLPWPDGNLLSPWPDLLPMCTAPRDGTHIMIRFEHQNYHYAHSPEERRDWEQLCDAHWIDFNNGGWTWHGIAGRATGWRPM